ncbi:MAG: hypothetical protein IJB86_08240 [Clostridia bacterium]|nr:hypothetical protein [Clostridia bacterium]
MKKIKKIAAVILSSSLMTSLFTMISFAGETTSEQAASDGKLFDFIKMLFSNVDWGSIITILKQTIQTLIDMFN